MKCLECKWAIITEDGYNGKLGATVIDCFICNEINSDMEDCKDFEQTDVL